MAWWYNNKTGEVTEGKFALGKDLDGPFETKADAENAPEIARQRALRWKEEEDSED